MTRRRSRRPGRRRLGWLGLAAVGLGVVVSVAWWMRGPGERSAPMVDAGDLAPADPVRVGAARAVRGNPGFETLGAADRERAARALSEETRWWLRDHAGDVRAAAAAFEVSPVALGGIVAAERTLLVGRVDDLGDDLFQAVFGSLRDRDLERWVRDRETRFRQGRTEGGASGGSLVKNPYLWTLGPAQVSFRLAVQYEPAIARRLGRPERSAKDVLRAVVSDRGNLEYAAALLAEAQRAYLQIAGMDIADNPGVLGTLYHLGAPTVRASRLAADNAARAKRGEPASLPQVNFYGAFINLHAGEIADLVGAPRPD